MFRRIIALAALAGLTVLSWGQENSVSVDLQVMGRGESRDGGLPNADDPTKDYQAFIQSRSRLVIDYQRPELEVKTSMQHSGKWGQADNGFNVYEAWIKLNTPWGLFTKIGKQALSYDDERIIGPNDWNMVGNTHDVLLAGYEGYGHKFHIAGTYYYNTAMPYRTMQMAWYHYDLPVAPVGLSLMFMNIGMPSVAQEDQLEWQQAYGAYVKYAPDNMSFEASYYRQAGKTEEGSLIDAWMASAKATYNPWKLIGFEAGYDYLSGDDTYAVPGQGQIGLVRHDVVKGFNPVYGSHHKFYGAMDFFYVSTYVNGFSPGLQNAYAGIQVRPMPGMNIGLSYHYLAIATKLQDIGRTLGHELEMQASWTFIKDVSVSLGLSYMIGTHNMQLLKRASEDGRLFWAWISLQAAPRILNYKW